MPKTKINQKEAISKRNLTEQESADIHRLKQRTSHNIQTLFRSRDLKGKEALELALDETLEHKDAVNLMHARLMITTGSRDSIVALRLLSNVGKALVPAHGKGKDLALELDELALSMQTLAPQDEYEGQLVAQLVVLHEHALNWLGRAIRSERVDFANIYLNGASKLLARHHETLESLLKYRRKGEQRVHVEHVHVHGGGQAIVGNVSTGVGITPKFEEGPHAKV